MTHDFYQYAPARPPPPPPQHPNRLPSPNPQSRPPSSGYSVYNGRPNRHSMGPGMMPTPGPSRPVAATAPHLQQPYHTSYPASPQQGGYHLQAPGLQQPYSQPFQSPYQQLPRPPSNAQHMPYHAHAAVSPPATTFNEGERLPNPYDRPLPSTVNSASTLDFGMDSNGNLRPSSHRISSTPEPRHDPRLPNPHSSGSSQLPAPPPPPRPGSSTSVNTQQSVGPPSKQSSITSTASQQSQHSQHSQQGGPERPGHEFDDCPGCRAELEEALAASVASAQEEEQRRKQREEADILAISARETEEARKRAEEERVMLERAVETSRKEAELERHRHAQEEELALEESRQAALRDSERAAEEDRRQLEEAFKASQAEERRRAEALQHELDSERAAIAESMRQQEEEWRRREDEQRSLAAFYEHQSSQAGASSPRQSFSHSGDTPGFEHEDTDAEYWRFAGHTEAYDLAQKMKRASINGQPMTAGSSRSGRRPLPPVPGAGSSAPASIVGQKAVEVFSDAQPDDVPFDSFPLDAPPPYDPATAPSDVRFKPAASSADACAPQWQNVNETPASSPPHIGAMAIPSSADVLADLHQEPPSPVESFAGPSPAGTARNSREGSPAVERTAPIGQRTSSLAGRRSRRASTTSRDDVPLPTIPSSPPPLQGKDLVDDATSVPVPESAAASASASSSPELSANHTALGSTFVSKPRRASHGALSLPPIVDENHSERSEHRRSGVPDASPASASLPVSASSLSTPSQSQAKGKKAIAGVDFGFTQQPFGTQLEKVHEPSDGESAAKYFFPNALQLTDVTATSARTPASRNSAEAGTHGPYFVIRAHSWKSLLRALAWYGNTRIEAGPEEVADAAACASGKDRHHGKCLLSVEIEFVTPTKLDTGYGVGEYARYAQSTGMMPRTKSPAHVAICMSLIPSPSAARAFHKSALYKASQGESKRLDAFYAGRGSARRLITLPRQPPSLPVPMVKLAQHLHLAHTFSAACPSTSHIARHSPRDLHHAIERHDEGFIKRQKVLASATAVLANGSSSSVGNPNPSSLSLTTVNTRNSLVNSMLQRPSIDTIASGSQPSSRPSESLSNEDSSAGRDSHVNLMDSEHEDDIDFDNIALEDGNVEVAEAMGKRARLKAKVKRRLGKRAGDGNVVDEDLATWITPFDVNEHD